jgi:phosphatidylinositol alpha 1,6-mannosyltransferase
MRVAVVAETFVPAVNGVVNSVLRAVDHLAVRGHDPVVVAPSGSSYESRCGAQVEVVTVPAMRLPQYRQLALARPAADLTPVLHRLRPDVVHLASPAVLGLAAARASRTLGVPSVAVFQTDLAAYAQRYRLPGGPAAAWRYLRTVHGTADLTLAPSSATAAQLARQGIGPVEIWPRGVDLDQFAPDRRDPALRATLTPQGELLVGVVARLAVEKRLELLAPLSELPGVQLVVVGDGPQPWSPRWTCSCTPGRTRRSARRCRRRWLPGYRPWWLPPAARWTWCGTGRTAGCGPATTRTCSPRWWPACGTTRLRCTAPPCARAPRWRSAPGVGSAMS